MLRSSLCKEFGLLNDDAKRLLTMAYDLGLIEEIENPLSHMPAIRHESPGTFSYFKITFDAVDASRKIHASIINDKQRNQVEHIENRIKRNPFAAWVIIIIIAICIVYPVVVDLLERFGAIPVSK